MGGEKVVKVDARLLYLGSPPRGRGKALANAGFTKTDRITPAWAGKRRFSAASLMKPRDHPRVGGEKALMPTNALVVKGSPPHGRGKGVRSGVHRCCRGITPAWAGKSPLRPRRARPPPDHPRTGGEKQALLYNSVPVPGSPPRGRGKEASIFDDGQRLGITPA